MLLVYRPHYAWVVLAVVFVTMLVSSAALGVPGAFVQPLSREFGWSTDQISSALAVRFALYGLIGPFAATLMGWCSAQRSRIVGSSVGAVSCSASSRPVRQRGS